MEIFPTPDEFLFIFLPAYAVAVLGGVAITYSWSAFLHCLLARRFPQEAALRKVESALWLPILMGVLERSMITTFVFYIPAAIGPFSGAWITIKAVGGWGIFKEPTAFNRALFMTGLLGSVMSIGFAIVVGLVAKGILISQ
jgi:hypothetical protein